MAIRQQFTEEQLKEIRNAIADAERRTSGEIRVHIESRCKEDVMDHAAAMFAQLHMHETAARNGVLIYLATEDRKFAIIGDAGINARVGDDFWQTTYDHALPHLCAGRWTTGLTSAIAEAGEALAEHFPYQADDVNELSDEISFGR
jgi:uncharacterized membrane protein